MVKRGPTALPESAGLELDEIQASEIIGCSLKTRHLVPSAPNRPQGGRATRGRVAGGRVTGREVF